MAALSGECPGDLEGRWAGCVGSSPPPSGRIHGTLLWAKDSGGTHRRAGRSRARGTGRLTCRPGAHWSRTRSIGSRDHSPGIHFGRGASGGPRRRAGRSKTRNAGSCARSPSTHLRAEASGGGGCHSGGRSRLGWRGEPLVIRNFAGVLRSKSSDQCGSALAKIQKF